MSDAASLTLIEQKGVAIFGVAVTGDTLDPFGNETPEFLFALGLRSSVMLVVRLLK